MTQHDDPVENGPLAHRLRTVRVPDADVVLARTLRAYDAPVRRGRRSWRAPMIVAAVALLGAVAASPAAHAAAPAVERATSILERFGVMSHQAATAQVQPPVGALTSVRHGGRSLAVMGVIADGDRTVVLLHLEPSFLPGIAVLTDETGRVLPPVSGGGGGAGGTPAKEDAVMLFEGTTPGPHQLTLSWQPAPTPGPGAPPGLMPAPGDWTLRFAVTVRPSVDGAAAPAQGRAGRIGVTVQAVRAGDYALHVQLRVSGITEMDGPEGAALGVSLTDAAGRPVEQVEQEVGGGTADGTWTVDRYWRSGGPGTYRLVVSFQGQRFESQITVPAAPSR